MQKEVKMGLLSLSLVLSGCDTAPAPSPIRPDGTSLETILLPSSSPTPRITDIPAYEPQQSLDVEAFRQKVSQFTFERSLNRSYEDLFMQEAIKAYLKLSGSGTIDTGNFYVTTLTDRDTFNSLAQQAGHNSENLVAMFVDGEKKTIVIDRQRIAYEVKDARINFGMAFLETLWDGLLMLDTTTNATGEFLNSPRYKLPDGSEWKAYLGGLVLSQDSKGFVRYATVLRQAVMVRLAEQIDQGRYHFINFPFALPGTSVLVPFSRKAGLSSQDLHRLYSKSEWEEAAERFGTLLPGDKSPKEKGYELFVAIDGNNANRLEELGVFKVISS